MHILHAYMHGYYYIINIHIKAGETLGPENICKSAAWIRAVVSNVGGGPLWWCEAVAEAAQQCK